MTLLPVEAKFDHCWKYFFLKDVKIVLQIILQDIQTCNLRKFPVLSFFFNFQIDTIIWKGLIYDHILIEICNKLIQSNNNINLFILQRFLKVQQNHTNLLSQKPKLYVVFHKSLYPINHIFGSFNKIELNEQQHASVL